MSYVERLQADLKLSEQRLHDALADAIAANAGLQASNADQRTLNEELRSANEELAASQSELQAITAELAGHVDELAHANSDMRGMIESTRIAIVFLDQHLRVRSFTPAVQDVVNIRAGDCGRAITDLTLRIAYAGLADDARHVLATHAAVERQAGDGATGARYLIRLLPYRGADDVVAGVTVSFFDITATITAERALRASEERFRRIAAAVPALLFIARPTMEWDYVNPPFYSETGQDDGTALGHGWFGAVHPEDLSTLSVLWQRADLGAATLEHETRLRRRDGSWRWFLLRAVPQLDGSGQVLRWYGSCTDIDERRRAERRQGLLLAELQHRIKNTLAVVRSVLTRTLESSSDIDHFATHLAGRIGALARTQSVAVRTAEGLVMLEDLVYQELAAHGGQDEQQVRVEGPPVSLPPKIADTIGLTIHELATNSLKYGAFAVPAGRVEVRWRIDRDAAGSGQRLRLEWQETNVPLTDLHPKRRGFGRELIEQGLPYELGAVTALQFRPGGARCTIEFTLADPAVGQAVRGGWQ